MSEKFTSKVLGAIEKSPSGITTLDVLESLRLGDRTSLKTVLSRLNKSKRIIRLKRGVYSANPIKDPFVAAQALFNGYIGFSSAIYLHRLIAEIPFTILVVTPSLSACKKIGQYEFRAISLKYKAIGFERSGNYVVSTRAKTLFDCVYLSKYSIERTKLVDAFKEAKLIKKEWQEFYSYVKKFAGKRIAKKFYNIKKEIIAK